MPPPLSGLKTLNFGLKTSIFDLTEFILILMLFSALRHTKVYFHFFRTYKNAYTAPPATPARAWDPLSGIPAHFIKLLCITYTQNRHFCETEKKQKNKNGVSVF